MAHPAAGTFSWATGSVHPEIVLGVAALGAAWMGAWIARGEPVPRGRAAFFFGGLATFLVALNGPLHDAAERYLFSAHMVQHLLLTLIAPPCLLAGMPTWMGDAVVGRGRRGRLVRALTRPVPSLMLYTAALAVWHFPAPYDAALETPAWHIAEHASLVVTATLAWWPVLGPSTIAPPLHYGAQILHLFVFGMPMTVIAALVTGAEAPLYEFYVHAPRITRLDPLEDQRLGGLIMWVPAGIVPLAAFTAVFFRWVAAERDDADDPATHH
ncbi:MAG: cytochrome c oxidase assembly protein [Candidatus Rokubacteria bacterium]|nr:cytochrome c oxidase assembly protein [Candidatus Rokubacteria bacterium]